MGSDEIEERSGSVASQAYRAIDQLVETTNTPRENGVQAC
jgi:hypothetical protein